MRQILEIYNVISRFTLSLLESAPVLAWIWKIIFGLFWHVSKIYYNNVIYVMKSHCKKIEGSSSAYRIPSSRFKLCEVRTWRRLQKSVLKY